MSDVFNTSPDPVILTGGGTKDLLHTETANSYPSFTFFNYSGSATTVTIYMNGTSDQHKRAIIELDANGGFATVTDLDLASGATIYAEASAAASVSCQKLVLTYESV